MLRILYDYQMFDAQVYGGISRYFVNLIKGIGIVKDVQVDISVLYTKNYYLKTQKQFKLDNVIGHVILSRQKRLTKWNKNFSRYRIMQDDFDLFHPTYYHPYFLDKLNKPFVITVHDMIYELYPEYFNADDFTAQHKLRVIEAATHIIAISHATKSDLMRLLNVPEDRITVVYHGHTPIANLNTPDVLLPKDYVLFVGGRDQYKNFDVFAAAFARLAQHYPQLRLICAGGGAFLPAETDRMIKLGISDRVTQYNASDDFLYWLYKGSMVFVYPSLYEGFGLPILEAYEADCPVILSNTPSFVEVAGDAAIYFDADSIDDIARCLFRILDDKELRDELILKGKERLKYFTIDKCISETIAVYRKCISA